MINFDSSTDETLDIHPTAKVHPAAIVEAGARLGANVEVGPWTFVGSEVEIGEGTVLNSHVVVKGPTTIGRNNRIYQFASVGEACQDKKYAGEPTRLEIGDDNIIREGCTVHRGTVQDEWVTKIGNNNLLMAYVHIAHDCVIGNDCIMANNSTLAGHVNIGDGVILGGFTAIHQYCKIGAYSMSAGNTTIFKDVPAFIMTSGSPGKPYGMNFEGMRRRGYSPELIRILRQTYKIIYRQGLRTAEAIEKLEPMAEVAEVRMLLDSIKSSTRGIIR